jgi:hypothetical protein
VRHSGRTARIHPRAERLPEPEVHEAPVHDENFFPEVVTDRLGRFHAGGEAQQPRDVARLGIVAQDLLLDAGTAGAGGRRAGDRTPGDVVGAEEFERRLGQCYPRK